MSPLSSLFLVERCQRFSGQLPRGGEGLDDKQNTKNVRDLEGTQAEYSQKILVVLVVEEMCRLEKAI